MVRVRARVRVRIRIRVRVRARVRARVRVKVGRVVVPLPDASHDGDHAVLDGARQLEVAQHLGG